MSCKTKHPPALSGFKIKSGTARLGLILIQKVKPRSYERGLTFFVLHFKWIGTSLIVRQVVLNSHSYPF